MRISTVILFALCLSAGHAAECAQHETNLRALGELTKHVESLGTTFAVSGDVAYVCNADSSRIDLVSRDRLHHFWFSAGTTNALKSGDFVLLSGHVGTPTSTIQNESSLPCVPYVDHVVRLGEAKPRHHEIISGGRISCGDFTSQAVAVRGVLSGSRRDELNPNWNWFALRTSSGKVFVATPDREHPLHQLKSLTDATVLVTGIVSPSQRPSSFVSFYLIPVGPSGISCLVPPPKDLMSSPPLPTSRQTNSGILYPLLQNLLSRHLIRGCVLGTGTGRIFLQMSNGFFCSLVPEDQEQTVSPGTTITASGFPEVSACGLDLTEAVISQENVLPRPLPEGENIQARDLFGEQDGKDQFNRQRQGSVIRISGLVANSRENILYEGIIRLACGEHTVPVDVSNLKGRIEEMPDTGYRLSVTGICFGSFTSGQTTSDLPVFTGFTVYPRVTEDILILSRPSWWTAGRLLGIILALLVVIVAILIWNRSLAVLSARRGKRLYLEAIAHTKAELKVEERTHLAVELHDALSQTLTGVALQLDSACLANKNGNSRVGQVLEVAKSMLTSCRKELHNCLWDLRSRTFEEKDMTEAIVRTLAPYTDDTEITVRFNVPRSIFEETQSHAILRMVRELVVNAITHGQAKHIWIAGEHHDGRVSFSVRDNGCGFDQNVAPGPRQGHFGLQGVRERLDKLDGTLDIQSIPGKGTKINVHLHIQGEEHA